MPIFSFHLAATTPATTLRSMRHPPERPGLLHAEVLAAMKLGSPIFSADRMQLQHLALFASWESEAALDDFLAESPLGGTLAAGWHVRLKFLRRWGRFPEFANLPDNTVDTDPTQPVVAVTLARLQLPQVSRFIRWGKPVEKQVRDHPGTTLALAANRPPRTFSTFSIWRSQQEMTDMVHGKNNAPGADRHAAAMAERERKDFHHQFATFRFRALSEHGEWMGRNNFVPKSK